MSVVRGRFQQNPGGASTTMNKQATSQAKTQEAPLLTMKGESYLLEVNNLKKYFAITRGLMARLSGYTKAADDVSFFIRKGETLGLVGESGCGKTTVGRCVVRVYEPTSGQVLYHGGADGKAVDLATLDRRTLKPYRQDIRMIFQDPYSSLNPRMTVFEIVGEVLSVNGIA